jgi:hypothetical protein
MPSGPKASALIDLITGVPFENPYGFLEERVAAINNTNAAAVARIKYSLFIKSVIFVGVNWRHRI